MIQNIKLGANNIEVKFGSDHSFSVAIWCLQFLKSLDGKGRGHGMCLGFIEGGGGLGSPEESFSACFSVYFQNLVPRPFEKHCSKIAFLISGYLFPFNAHQNNESGCSHYQMKSEPAASNQSGCFKSEQMKSERLLQIKSNCISGNLLCSIAWNAEKCRGPPSPIFVLVPAFRPVFLIRVDSKINTFGQ